MDKLYHAFREHPIISTDTRKPVAGSIFFALRGEHFDGNRYAAQAIAQGAAFAVVSDPDLKGAHYFHVPDTLKALQRLARHHRLRLDIPVLAITGSNGKTTTKELVRDVLARKYQVSATRGNFNNHIGVPLSILEIPAEAEFAIIEMGANHIGEIADLCRIAEPDYGLITNIGKAQLEGFGSLEGVKRGKSELYRWLADHQGCAFVNRDQTHLENLSADIKTRIFYQLHPLDESEQAPGAIEVLPELDALRFWDSTGVCWMVRNPLFGEYNRQNIATAITVGLHFEVDGGQIVEAIESYQARNNRSEVRQVGQYTFYLDAYNANPTSMRGAISSFQTLSGTEKILVLGAMKELGDESPAEHLALVQSVSGDHWKAVILVGEEFSQALEREMPASMYYAKHTDDAAILLKSLVVSDCKILLKGSRSIGLEKIIRAFN